VRGDIMLSVAAAGRLSFASASHCALIEQINPILRGWVSSLSAMNLVCLK
jgi:hypothetical protein